MSNVYNYRLHNNATQLPEHPAYKPPTPVIGPITLETESPFQLVAPLPPWL